MKIIIKVGSQAIISADGVVLEDVMSDIIRQIITLQRQGIQVILVSSGAVAMGRLLAQKIANHHYTNNIADKQLLASLGQPRLMAIYAKICETYKVLSAQLLLTKYDFQTKRAYTNILRLLQKSMSQADVLTIINENDSVAVEELIFTDNDELAGIIAAQVNADKLLLLTSVDGVYDRDPDDPGAQLIPILKSSDHLPQLKDAKKTTFGRGGISSKLNTARKMAAVGIMTHIANITQKDVILRLVNNENVGSRVIPEHKKSGTKRFLAFGQSPTAAKIMINNCLFNILADDHSCISILPIGIVKFTGAFVRGDLIEIINEQNKKIGVGVARYNSQKLTDYIGEKNKPALIHYDYLHINYDS